MEEILLDRDLWFEHKGCEGNHYLIGNPHTHYGRMWAWCPKKKRSFFVSKSEMSVLSEKSRYWVAGFLAGNQPPPPTNEQDQVDFEGIAYGIWLK